MTFAPGACEDENDTIYLAGVNSREFLSGASGDARARRSGAQIHQPRLISPMSPGPGALASGHNGYVQARRVAGSPESVASARAGLSGLEAMRVCAGKVNVA